MKYPLLIAIAIAAMLLPACQSLSNVEIVNDRNADGTFKATNEVVNGAGESPDSYAKIFHYPSGAIGVSVWHGGVLANSAPNLKR